ncbi:MAG TPA: hypothetical protein VNM14_13735 [Planctomycetota bacterium]|nr:hypothetical protein [Planctomycetota bacterium]
MTHSTASRFLIVLALLFCTLPVAAFQDEKKQDEPKLSPQDKKAQEDAAKKAVDEFSAKMKEAKTISEKALLILNFGDVEPKDKCMVTALGKYLGATSSDINFILVTSAVDSLGRFRGSPHAAATLTAALAGYKKNPYVSAKIAAAIGKVGHESSLPTYEEMLKGTDQEAAARAVWAIADFSALTAVDFYFRENERIEKERKKQGIKDEYKKVYDRVQPELLKAMKQVTKQPWVKFDEFGIWYTRHHGKEELIKMDKERKLDPVLPRTTIPPVLLVELTFKENAGTTPANGGASAAAFPAAQMTDKKPSWTATAAPNGGPSALDFDKTGGLYAVDLGGGAGIENLKNLKSFTITGWTICMDVKEGPSDKMAGAGNRIVSWFNPFKVNEGVELVFRTDGSLQLGIGEWAEGSAARSKPGQIPLYDSKATNAGTEAYEKWRFFAVTYDSGLAKDHVKFYVAPQNKDPQLVNAADYNRGPSGGKISPQMTVGNVPPMIRPMAPERSYRGILDEIRIYGSTLDGSGALPLEELIKIQNRVKQGT